MIQFHCQCLHAEKAHADQFTMLVKQARESRQKKSTVKKESPTLDDTLTSDQTTPPISPVFPSRLSQPSTSFNTKLTTPSNRKLSDITTPTNRKSIETTLTNRKLIQATPTNRKLKTPVPQYYGDGVSFYNLSPVFDDGMDSDQSTPELNRETMLTVYGVDNSVLCTDVFALDSPENNGQAQGGTDLMFIPER